MSNSRKIVAYVLGSRIEGVRFYVPLELVVAKHTEVLIVSSLDPCLALSDRHIALRAAFPMACFCHEMCLSL